MFTFQDLLFSVEALAECLTNGDCHVANAECVGGYCACRVGHHAVGANCSKSCLRLCSSVTLRHSQPLNYALPVYTKQRSSEITPNCQLIISDCELSINEIFAYLKY